MEFLAAVGVVASVFGIVDFVLGKVDKISTLVNGSKRNLGDCKEFARQLEALKPAVEKVRVLYGKRNDEQARDMLVVLAQAIEQAYKAIQSITDGNWFENHFESAALGRKLSRALTGVDAAIQGLHLLLNADAAEDVVDVAKDVAGVSRNLKHIYQKVEGMQDDLAVLSRTTAEILKGLDTIIVVKKDLDTLTDMVTKLSQELFISRAIGGAVVGSSSEQRAAEKEIAAIRAFLQEQCLRVFESGDFELSDGEPVYDHRLYFTAPYKSKKSFPGVSVGDTVLVRLFLGVGTNSTPAQLKSFRKAISRHNWSAAQSHSASKLYGFIALHDNYGIVMKYYANGTLADMIKGQKDADPEKGKIEYLHVGYQLLQAIHSLHLVKVNLGTYTPQDIYFDFDKRPILGDLTSAKVAAISFSNFRPPPSQMAWPYKAPEAFAVGVDVITEKTDVWNFGCIMLELITGERPYNDTPLDKLDEVIGLKRQPPRIPEKDRFGQTISPDVQNTLVACFKAEPEDRIAMDSESPKGLIQKFAVFYGEAMGNGGH